MPDPARTVTPRGFTVYDEFTDTYGATIKVQQSSSASGPRCWIFASASAGERDTMPPRTWPAGSDPSPHLDVAQARRVRDALDAFIREHDDA